MDGGMGGRREEWKEGWMGPPPRMFFEVRGQGFIFRWVCVCVCVCAGQIKQVVSVMWTDDPGEDKLL